MLYCTGLIRCVTTAKPAGLDSTPANSIDLSLSWASSMCFLRGSFAGARQIRRSDDGSPQERPCTLTEALLHLRSFRRACNDECCFKLTYILSMLSLGILIRCLLNGGRCLTRSCPRIASRKISAPDRRLLVQSEINCLFQHYLSSRLIARHNKKGFSDKYASSL